jgi:toxic protein SymE
MQTYKKKTASKRPAVRSLKIQPQIRINRWTTSTVPEIKLCGNWLEKLGFIPEQRVNITTMNKLLIIRVDE